MRIDLPGDFHPEHLFRYLSRSDKERLHLVEDNSVYKWVKAGSNEMILSIRFHGQELQVANLLGDIPPEKEAWVQEYIEEWWDLGLNLDEFYRICNADGMLSGLLETLRGVRIIGVHDLFEALSWAIVGQQINLPFAYTLKQRLVENYGEAMEYDGRVWWQFPTPEIIAGLKVETLRGLALTTKKSEYLMGVAEEIGSGRLRKEDLLDDVDHAYRRLTALRGIGPWAANYVLMRCLRYTKAFPVGDVGLQNAVKKQLGMDRKPTEKELLELAENWKGWEAYATFYLWQSL